MLLEIGLILLGFMGLLMRRNLIALGFSFLLIFLGILLWLYLLSATQIALILSIVFSLQMLLYGVLVIFVWRNRGTLHIDEIRELRG
ncbi:MAG: NADH-quinone oxidoreductase subunit K [Myxococcaceae bacterium]